MSSVKSIVVDYFDSLRSARDRRFKLPVLLVQIGFPVLMGVVFGAVGLEIANSGEVVTGVSIVAALMCGVATLLFQIRVNLREKFEDESQAFLTQFDLDLVDELFAQVMWCILTGFFLVLLILAKGVIPGLIVAFPLARNFGLGLMWGLMTNFILTVGLVLKRLNRVYYLVAANKRNRQ